MGVCAPFHLIRYLVSYYYHHHCICSSLELCVHKSYAFAYCKIPLWSDVFQKSLCDQTFSKIFSNKQQEQNPPEKFYLLIFCRIIPILFSGFLAGGRENFLMAEATLIFHTWDTANQTETSQWLVMWLIFSSLNQYSYLQFLFSFQSTFEMFILLFFFYFVFAISFYFISYFKRAKSPDSDRYLSKGSWNRLHFSLRLKLDKKNSAQWLFVKLQFVRFLDSM